MTSPYSTVYRCYGTEGRLLYVGVTGDITHRVYINQHGNPRYGHLSAVRRREVIRAEIDALPVSPRPAVVVHELSDEEQERRYLAFVPGPDFLRRPTEAHVAAIERHLTQPSLTQVVPQRRRRTA